MQTHSGGQRNETRNSNEQATATQVCQNISAKLDDAE
jgi:hypothetical protein